MFANAIATADAKGASRETFKRRHKPNRCAIAAQRHDR
jgi:hypothetical protein